MRNYLIQENACFYHITTGQNWQRIQTEGLRSQTGRIFVSISGEFPVLISIAMEQLPEIRDDSVTNLIFLRLPHSLNNFQVTEIIRDPQAPIEWSNPLQFIIHRDFIPITNIELMMDLSLGRGPVKANILATLDRTCMQAGVFYNGSTILNWANNIQL